ncbi:MAG: FkbM family methyltransferase [Planctomycetes bacterium]|nr:FkbM family methyltransferase [Planctomycetota bacterium]
MQPVEVGTMEGPLRLLCEKGIRYSTVIDVGCADGSFFLTYFAKKYLPGAVPFNIDANALYRESLKAIQDVVGGHYRICAATDHEGEIELTTSVNPYWSSLRPEGDAYWQRINQLSATKTKVPATTLDTLRRQLGLKPPFLLKLDVQGAEESVLRGATGVLQETHLVICEADLDDFQNINKILTESGFVLYDATHLTRLQDGSLGWFYPVYINRKLDALRPKNFWDTTQNASMIQQQQMRRQKVLKMNAEILQWIREQKASATGERAAPASSAVGRNDPCPCGSGRKYKQCCGANA